jgi:hypothetical protein
MAQDFISQLFGSAPDYSSVMSPEQTQSMKQNALAQGGIQALVALLGASGQQPRNISTGQALAGALGAGYGGYQQSFDTTLKQMLTAQQLEDYKTKKQKNALFEQAMAKATTMQPQAIPMSTAPGSQLEMLSRPEFGGDMAGAETIAAMRDNLPMGKTVDFDKLVQAISIINPVEAAKLMQKEDTTPSSIREAAAFAKLPLDLQKVFLGLQAGKAPKNIIDMGSKNLYEIDKEPVAALTNQALSSRLFANTSTQINELLKGKGGGTSVKIGTELASALNLPSDTVAAQDLANSLNVQTAVKVRPPGSGGTSNIEFGAYTQTIPGLGNSEKGRELMAQANNAFATRNEKLADFARNEYKKGEFSLTRLQAYDNSLGAVLPKDFFDQVKKVTPDQQDNQPKPRRSFINTGKPGQ